MLTRAGGPLQVCEAASEYIPQGAGVLVNLNGQHALEAIDPALYERQDAVHKRVWKPLLPTFQSKPVHSMT